MVGHGPLKPSILVRIQARELMLDIEFTESKISPVATKLLKELKAGDILALKGQLAAGKTTLTRALMEKMGYKGRVSSPTFVIEHRYPNKYKKISEVIHLDLYRLNTDEAKRFDWSEYLNQKNKLVIIEWPDRAEELLPKNTKEATIDIHGEHVRHLRFPTNTIN